MDKFLFEIDWSANHLEVYLKGSLIVFAENESQAIGEAELKIKEYVNTEKLNFWITFVREIK